MSDETRKQIIKAFSYSVPVEVIAENTGLTKDEVVQFAEDYKEAIVAEMEFNQKKGRWIRYGI